MTACDSFAANEFVPPVAVDDSLSWMGYYLAAAAVAVVLSVSMPVPFGNALAADTIIAEAPLSL